ncbi:MAG: aspartate/tyrosine/aromatic aminotransferase [Myxococcales bacterium]|nr:aspartate/tyrosine/aromatic aminotransferase [Myxococcales bacterium]
MFERLESAPADPILGLTEAFRADPRDTKINLGVGVFKNDEGKTPSLECVHRAEKILAESDIDRSYLPITGPETYGKEVRQLLLGALASDLGARAMTAQTPGGTGALRVAADFVAKHRPGKVWLSDPTWANHNAIFKAAGLEVKSYRYYDAERRGIDLEGMLEDLARADAQDLVLLHASCHNPTGFDPTPEQWQEIQKVQAERGFLTLFDTAYQGFGDGLDEDVASIRTFARGQAPFFVASSFSKNFSLYNERVGALTFVGESSDEAARVFSHVKIAIRTNYSNPARHGGALVTAVLTNPELKTLWEQEVSGMRARLRDLRGKLVEALKASGAKRDFGFMLKQKGMFSYTGLSPEEVDQLTQKHGVYMVRSGRINVAGITSKNLPQLVAAITDVTG